MDRIDEAVLNGLRARNQDDSLVLSDFDGDGIDQRKLMRAALLAGMKVLLGEPVAWQYLSQASDEPRWTFVGKPMADVFAKHGNPVRELYAPSLGEGDGR